MKLIFPSIDISLFAYASLILSGVAWGGMVWDGGESFKLSFHVVCEGKTPVLIKPIASLINENTINHH